jgi:hypothetical protein
MIAECYNGRTLPYPRIPRDSLHVVRDVVVPGGTLLGLSMKLL